MSLAPGTRLGPYEIVSALGAGGMGEVYKAKDTRLDRTVAIKVLPTEVSADPDRRARFAREARTIAGLNHPHICTLHDVGEHPATGSEQATLYLVMEHLTGETLAQRLEKGPLPIDEALEVGIQIADALAVAHKLGIVHRDLKPGNVMLTKTGAKLLDFGLAKLRAPGAVLGTDFSSLPTQAAPETEKGTILGTLAYMAPEQLEGKDADAHSDIFSFGAVLYEMLTGTRAFTGTSPASVISAVMSSQPPSVSTLQTLTPPLLERLVQQCLVKTPDDRPDSAHDVTNELRWLRETNGIGAPAAPRHQRRRVFRTAWLVGGGLLLFVAGFGVRWSLHPSAPAASIVRSALPVSPAETLNAGGVVPMWVQTPGGSRSALAWTPDGQALVFVGRRGGVQQLYVRRLEAAEARALVGTEGAQVPAVSPDGQWVAFWAGGAIRKVPLAGGPVMDVSSDLPIPPFGLAWDAGGRLFYGTQYGSIRVVSPEGTVTAVTKLGGGEVYHMLPSLLPSGRVLLYTVRKRVASWGDEEVVAQTLATGARRVLVKDAADARYVPSGHLVFLRRGVLFGVALDAERLEVRGTPVAVLDEVAQAIWLAGSEEDITGAGQFAVATTGTLAWLPGPVVPFPDGALVTVDRRGRVARLPAPVKGYVGPVRLSPDGRWLAVTTQTTIADSGVWAYEVDRGTLTLLASGGDVGWPIWWPDGLRLAFDWVKDGRRTIVAQRANGMAPPQVLVEGSLYPSSFTPDGRTLLAVSESRDIVSVATESAPANVQPLIQTDHEEIWPEVSTDGRWLAYGSDVSGRFEVYVQPYPGPVPAAQVSLEGGWSPAWHRNGRELFFQSPRDPAGGKQQMLAVEFTPGSPPRIGRPRVLFEFDNRDLVLSCKSVRCYDVAPDGQRFYGVQETMPPGPPVVTHINLIQNWFEELKAKVPHQ